MKCSSMFPEAEYQVLMRTAAEELPKETIPNSYGAATPERASEGVHSTNRLRFIIIQTSPSRGTNEINSPTIEQRRLLEYLSSVRSLTRIVTSCSRPVIPEELILCEVLGLFRHHI